MTRQGRLWITSDCDVEGCEGTVRFGAAGRRARRVGACDECGEQYSLYAGVIDRLPHADPGDRAASAEVVDDHHLLAG